MGCPLRKQLSTTPQCRPGTPPRISTVWQACEGPWSGAQRDIVTDLYGFIGTLAAGIVIIVTFFDRADVQRIADRR